MAKINKPYATRTLKQKITMLKPKPSTYFTKTVTKGETNEKPNS